MTGVRPRALDHVGLEVSDMDRSLRFYCDGLGLELLRRAGKGPGVASAVLRVGNQEMNLFSDPAFDAPRTAGNPTGMDHFCLEVENHSVDDLVAGLGRAGIAVTQGPTRRSDGMSLFVGDPDGVRVELIVKDQVAAHGIAGDTDGDHGQRALPSAPQGALSRAGRS